MVWSIRHALPIALAAALGALSMSAVRADVLRIAIVEAENDADYASNVALLPTFVDLMKKGGAKSVTVGGDAAKKSIGTSSVWGSAADIAKLTGTDDWKAAAGKLKRKAYTAEVFEVAP